MRANIFTLCIAAALAEATYCPKFVLDVRSAAEAASGKLSCAKVVDWSSASSPEAFVSEVKTKLGVTDVDGLLDAEFLVHCKSGFRAGQAIQALKAANFRNINSQLDDGLGYGWNAGNHQVHDQEATFCGCNEDPDDRDNNSDSGDETSQAGNNGESSSGSMNDEQSQQEAAALPAAAETETSDDRGFATAAATPSVFAIVGAAVCSVAVLH